MRRRQEFVSIRAVFACGAFLLSMHACSTAPSQRSITDAPVFERGFQIFPSPRTFDAPGTIFRVDSDQVRHPVADLSGMLHLVPREEAVPRLSVQGMFSTGAFLSWLSGERRGLQFQRIDSAIVAVSGAKREQAFEVDLARVLDSARRVIDWRKPGKIYLITETVSADSVQIHLSTSIGVMVGDSLKADSAKAHGIAIQWRPQAATDISLRFPKPYRVFYKVDQVARPDGFEEYPGRSLVHLPVQTELFWKEER
jgi:hypothetical protein